jgi:hypothetical protein
MSELNERMRGVDHVPFQDDWDAVERRAASPRQMPDPAGGRGVRVVAVLAATFVVVGAALYGLSGLGSSTDYFDTGPASSDMASYVNPMDIPITVDYPSDWYAQSVSQDSNPDPSVTGRPQIGLVVSNAPQAMPSPGDDSSPGPLPDDPDLPSTFVTVTIIHVADPCGTSGDPCHPGLLTPNSPLPLSMSDAQIVPGDANIAILEATVSMHHLTITLRAGPEASAADLARADAIVASIRPSTDDGPETSSYAAEDFVDGSAPLGDELAAALGLSKEGPYESTDGTYTGSCRYFVEVEESGEGYCLQDVAGDPVDLAAIAAGLRGHRIDEGELESIRQTLALASESGETSSG